MFIERLQVQEGFLDGLDVTFAPGLNVIIGARGTGKTSIIELIRYCLGAQAFTVDALARGRSQALSVLQDGRVSVTVTSGGASAVIQADATVGGLARTAAEFPCTVLAQNEIEAVGAQASGRLHLVDRFRSDRVTREQKLYQLRAEASSLSLELLTLLNEVLGLGRQADALKGTEQELVGALKDQSEILGTMQASSEDRSSLERLQAVSASLSVRADAYQRTAESVTQFAVDIQSLALRVPNLIEVWPSEGGPEDLMIGVRGRLSSIVGLLETVGEQAAASLYELADLGTTNSQEQLALSVETRELRRRLETLQAGAGIVTRKVADLQEKAAQLSSIGALLNERRTRFQQLQEHRTEVYSRVEEERQEIFDQRKRIAQTLTDALGPAVRVEISKSSSVDEYSSAIVAGLRGSGLHYNSLAPSLARKMSPLELVTAVENSDAQAISDAAEIALDRAYAVIIALREAGTSSIISSSIEDGVSLQLLDGIDYKDSDKISIGQRCTVVLPVLLNQHGDPLLVDQPEDHLDNAFIAKTLVQGLCSRAPEDQFIFASHNANIPVLAEADKVIVMDSDGRRGFVAHAGPLDDPITVKYVNSIMEGGPDAFERRASFYRGRRPGSQ